MQDLDVTAQLWGVTYSQIWAKEKGYAEFEKFSYTYSSAASLIGNQVFFR